VLGTASGVGKSLITTALARSYRRRGVTVAPFKAQNMSNNARVVAGGEIGVAQYLQALAAGVVPDIRMNPVLVKPEADTRSQVIINGRVDRALSTMPWRRRAPLLVNAIDEAFESLSADHDLVLVEGAGSPAEINLRDTDLANLHMLEIADGPAILVSDIDRGGAFAHLFGTWALVEPELRTRFRAFILNRFRGEAELLDSAPEQIRALTGMAPLGVMPLLRHDLPDEDGHPPTALRSGAAPVTVGIVSYPTASNVDEFARLHGVANVRWLTDPRDVHACDLVVLPGSKSVAADLRWLRDRGFDTAVRERVAAGRRVLAICGGAQMLGRELADEAGVDGSSPGVDLLKVRTVFLNEKLVGTTTLRFPDVTGAWSALSGLTVDAYEIRHGRFVSSTDDAAEDSPWIGFDGALLAVSAHGIFEDDAVLERLFGRVPVTTLDQTFEFLADAVEEHFDTKLLVELTGP
jgi:adenosylcobyric acid synthase